MILANNVKEALEKFDFTDSIITEIKWENNLFDLILTVDYYWDIQEGRESTRTLNIRFKHCFKADFHMTDNMVEFPENEVHSYALSWFTIVSLRQIEYSSDKLIQIEVCTTDFNRPWLIILCRDLQIEEIG